MRARRLTLILTAAFAIPTGAALAARAETAAPGRQAATPTRTVTTSGAYPRGHVLDCDTQSATGGGLDNFRSPTTLVVGPLAMLGARGTPFYSASFGGNKFALYVKAGHRVTLELSSSTRQGAGFAYGPRPANPSLRARGYGVVTFIACRRGQYSRSAGSTTRPASLWAGGILADSPRCVPFRIWVDNEARPRQAVINLGMRTCT
jgi:hypothetical protein